MNTIYTVLGLFSVSFGLIGIFVPVWPTTPFILLSVVFFSRSDKRFEDYILNNRWIGHHVRNYMENRQMNRTVKRHSILFVWTGLAISMFLQSNWIVIAILMVIGIAVTIHISLLNETKE